MKQNKVDLRQFKDKQSLSIYLKEKGLCRTSKDVDLWITKNIPLETYYQEKIIDYLHDFVKCFCWKAQAWGYSRGGIPDICCIIKGTYIGFEVKRPVVGEPSELQRQVKREIEENGCKVYFVTWVDEVIKILKESDTDAKEKPQHN